MQAHDPRDIIRTPNGIIHLPSGDLDLEPYGQVHPTTRITRSTRDDDGDCPRWRKFLFEVMDGDTSKVDKIQVMLGYMLTGRMDERCACLLFGEGHGKTVFLETIHHMLGSYACILNEQDIFHPSHLRGKRMAFSDGGFSANRLLSSKEQLRKIISGDLVEQRGEIYQDEVSSFKPECKLFFVVNDMKVNSQGLPITHWGVDREHYELKFSVRLPADMMDPRLLDKLKSESNAIFAWCLKGAQEWYRCHGLEW
jgi:putative DNA primase/helicase